MDRFRVIGEIVTQIVCPFKWDVFAWFSPSYLDLNNCLGRVNFTISLKWQGISLNSQIDFCYIFCNCQDWQINCPSTFWKCQTNVSWRYCKMIVKWLASCNLFTHEGYTRINLSYDQKQMQCLTFQRNVHKFTILFYRWACHGF